jgi:predicted ATP-grasp superfamily ATP-dependent carboligase
MHDTLALVGPDNLAALGVCRALGIHGIRCAVLSWDRTAPAQYSRYAERVPCPPMTDEAGFVTFLVEYGRRQARPPVLFLTDDSSLVIAQRHQARLEGLYRFPLGPWPVVHDLMLKDSLFRSLDGVVPMPRTAFPGDEADLAAAAEVGLPAVVKPLLRCLPQSAPAGQASFEKIFGEKAVRVRTREELGRAVRESRRHGYQVIVQEEIQGPISALASVGLYASGDGISAAFTSRKLSQVPPDFGDGLVVRAARVPEILPLAERVVRHVGFRGLADIEFKRHPTTGEYCLLDINPRPWLWINLPTACGVNLAYAAYRDAVGLPIDRTAFVQRDFETRWVSARGLAVALVRSVMSGRPLEHLRTLAGQLRGRRVGPLYARRDTLFRMFLNPVFWWACFRQSIQGVWRLHGALSHSAVPTSEGVWGSSVVGPPPSKVSR